MSAAAWRLWVAVVVALLAVAAYQGYWRELVIIAAVVALAGPAWYWWERPRELRRRRAVKGQCVRCGYDLRGNVSGVCPECGGAAPPLCTRCGYDLTGNVSGVCPECGAAK